MLKPTIIKAFVAVSFSRGGAVVPTHTYRDCDQPDIVIDVKTYWCQPCEHISVGVLAKSNSVSLLLCSMSSVLAASPVNLVHSTFNLLSTVARICLVQ